jgi:hypothetical protein
MHRKVYKFIISKKYIILLLVLVLHLLHILYSQRSYFLQAYDIQYWKDRFEHSQWQLPLSRRIIGDDGLFAYIGYQLVNGYNPALVNAETPPVGKYLIGLSILLFKNPAYYALFMGLGTLFLFYLIAQKMFDNKALALFCSLLLLLDPLFFSQFWKSWVDIAQLFFLLANVFFLLSFPTSKGLKKILTISASGFMLGLFTETKPAVLLPIILILESLYFYNKKHIKYYWYFLISFIIAVLISYARYFLLGFSIADFIKLQKYIASFYLNSRLEIHKNAIWQVLFIGKFPGITTGKQTTVLEWSALWPIITIIGILQSSLLLLRKQGSLIYKGISLYILSSFIVFTFIPSYTRYLLIVLPFLYIFFVKLISKVRNKNMQAVLKFILLLYGITNAYIFLIPSPEPLLKTFSYNLSHQYFSDVYQENLSITARPNISREEFRFISQRALQQATVKAISVEEIERNIPKFGNNGQVTILMKYKTQNLGGFSEKKTVSLVKEAFQWKVIWNWDIILSGFLPGYKAKTTITPGRRGSIVDKNGKPLAEDANGYLISVNPDKIGTEKEQEMLKFISSLSFQSPIGLQNAYLENALPNSYVPLATNFVPMSKKDKQLLLAYKGVSIAPHFSRIYYRLDGSSIRNTFFENCCTRIYSRYNYHGAKGLEKQYDNILSGYDGGRIMIINKRGKIVRTILEKSQKLAKM